MSIYIGNDLEDRLEALEVENASSKEYNLEDRLKALEKYNEYLRWYMKLITCQTYM